MTLCLNVAVCAACVALIALGSRAALGRSLQTPASVAGACLWALLLAVWAAYAGLGFVRTETPCLPVLAALLLAALCPLTLAAPGLHARMGSRMALALRLALPLAGVPVGLLLLELPYSEHLFQMDPTYVLLNLSLLAVGMACLWFLGQRSRWGALLNATACIVFGIANYFMCVFKGQTVLPSDLMAIGTAAGVSMGYEFAASGAPVAALCVYLGYLFLVVLAPPVRPTRRGVVVNLVVGLAAGGLLAACFTCRDFAEDFAVDVDPWATSESYMEFGSLAAFVQRVQSIDPQEPEGYGAQTAAGLRAELADAWSARNPDYPATLEESRALQAATTGTEGLPHVVVVMNESFSDLGIFPGVSGYAGLLGYEGIDAALSGYVYSSVRGGGTCNSEFEYLTGSTLACVDGGAYPYMTYDLAAVESLPKYFSALGYETSAVHPMAAENWQRDLVYSQLGFGAFYFGQAFAQDAQTLRGLVTDRETYDLVLGLLAQAQGPQFVFDVTVQNHGGYETGLLEEYPYDGVTVNGVSVAGMSEYLSCVDASQEDLAYFLGELAKLDEKVLVVFFGDHQPGFNDALAEAAYGVPVEDLSIDQVQQRYATPYLVWANYPLEGLASETDGAAAGGAETSLGYLMATTAYAAGLPLSEWQRALLQLQEEMPAVNVNAYMDGQGAWHWIGEDEPAPDALAAYDQLQYDQLFGAGGAGSLDALEEEAL